MLDNPDFAGEFNVIPYIDLDKAGQRRWNEFMSGNFSWRHATDIYEVDETTEGAMYCPIILGADKTTVSVATGHTLWDEYEIDDDILPFTHDFPRADIYEILTPDLLHQVIKGTFKDHLVTWVVHHYPHSLEALAAHINQPQLPTLACHFLFDQINKNPEVTSNDVDLGDCPVIQSKISVFYSAVASFFALSNECGLHGMSRERIQSCPLWQGKALRQDCAFIVEDEDRPGMCGMSVAHIQLFFSFTHNSKEYPCALVEWFSRIGRSRDSDTGMWKVHPDIQQGQCLCSVIHLDSILHGAHLLPIFGPKFLPMNFNYSYSLDAFAGYYVNYFADHHSHEIIF
ncbi:hypothetical protein BYT27DRAFT_7248786 [Phlegmacium glaucopus]|nr:hypothetical protein BYT27DRAFT_7248786 [Phlegmacium glaucopus]